MRTLSLSSLAVSAAAAAVLLAIPFYPPGVEVPRVPDESPTTVDAEELDAFARAFVAVAAAQQKIGRAPRPGADRAETLARKEQGEAEALTAISRAGLSLDRFKNILATVASDPNLRTAAMASIHRERARIAEMRVAPPDSGEVVAPRPPGRPVSAP